MAPKRPADISPAPSIVVFLEIFAAFKKIFGWFRPNADPTPMLLILKACYLRDFSSLKEIEEDTGLKQSTVSRTVRDLCVANVLQSSDRRSANASKAVELSPFGTASLKRFHRAMRNALKGYGKKTKQRTRDTDWLVALPIDRRRKKRRSKEA
jgi:DNA-binding MarR family transcriptional regulator